MLWLAAVAACLIAFPAQAQSADARCFLASPANISVADAISQEVHWDCANFPGPWAAERAIVRLPRDGNKESRYLTARLGAFDRLTIAGYDADGELVARSYMPEQVDTSSAGLYFTVEVPRGLAGSYVYAAFDGWGHRSTIASARLSQTHPADTLLDQRRLVMLAILLGMLLVPAVVDLALYRIIREPFILWHAVLSLGFAGLVLFRSGVSYHLVPLPMPELRASLVATMGLTVWAACMFTREFVEESALSTRLRNALQWAGIWAVFASTVYMLDIAWLRPLGALTHSIALLPVLAILCFALFSAFRAGSRSVRFQIAGWTPLLAALTLQLGYFVNPYTMPGEFMTLFYIGLLSETLVTMFGVADKLVRVKRESESARTRADIMGRLAERDALTGLLNRRAVDNRFEQLRRSGYDTLAILDLDHFKMINDLHGHSVGDEVLRVVGEVLASDPDNIAVRLGGEEFMLMLRGPMTMQRAERLRHMISVRVARSAPDLEHVVTASMGLIRLPDDCPASNDLSAVYSRADLLLYEAKNAGRNRTRSADWSLHDGALEAIGSTATQDDARQPAAA